MCCLSESYMNQHASIDSNQSHRWRHKWEQISRRLQASLDQKLSRSTKKTSWRNLNLHAYDEQDANTNGAAFRLSTISLRRPRWRAYIPATASKLSSHEIAGGKNDHLCTMIWRSEDCHIKLSAQWKFFLILKLHKYGKDHVDMDQTGAFNFLKKQWISGCPRSKSLHWWHPKSHQVARCCWSWSHPK